MIHLKDRGFELQLVPPDISFKALKRRIAAMSNMLHITKIGADKKSKLRARK